MLIYATCKCCTEKNKIIENYDTERLFKQTPEFRARLFNSLLEHLREIEKVCQSQGHYDKIWIKLDPFINKEKKIPTEILKEFLPKKELEKQELEKIRKVKKSNKPNNNSKDEEEPDEEELEN